MFNHLVASRGSGHRAWTRRTVILSATAHTTVLLALATLGVVRPKAFEKQPETVSYFELPAPLPPPPAPRPAPKAEEPPPKPQKPAPPDRPAVWRPAKPPPPKGYTTIDAPSGPPPIIPSPDPEVQLVTAQDVSGTGQAGGTPTGLITETVVPSMAKDTTPVFELEETGIKTELRNRHQIERMLQRAYPKRFAGVVGQVQLRFMIDEDGHVPPSSITVIVASNDAFGEVARATAERFLFRPIHYRGNLVRVWATMPVIFLPAP
jgi:TonB family protein